MRGEQKEKRLPKLAAAGSSPHARGAVRNFRAFIVVLRIIPACAGSRPSVFPKTLVC